MASILSLFSSSSNQFSMFLEFVPRDPTVIRIPAFSLLWQGPVIFQSLRLSPSLYSLLAKNIRFMMFFLLIRTRSDLQACIRWSICISKPNNYNESFSPLALADGFSLEFAWQQVNSSLKTSAQFSVRTQYCCCLDGLHFSYYFDVFSYVFQSFGDCSKCNNYNWYHRLFHVPYFFHFYSKFYYYLLIRAFQISINRWFFTGVWVTASLLKSPGLFSVFWPFSIMLSFG